MTFTCAYAIIHSTEYFLKEGIAKMDDGDSADTTYAMCNALTVVRTFHYIS